MRADYSYLLVCLACGGLGCASDHPRSTDARAAPTREEETPGVLDLAFSPMYSAYDGDHHSFRVPVRVNGAEGELEVSTSPPNFVEVEPSDEGVVLTTRQAGTATVTITDEKGQRGSARLVVTENRPDDVELGKERYDYRANVVYVPRDALDGGLLPFPEGGVPEGGIRFPEGGSPSPSIHGPEPCASCHTPAGPSAAVPQIDGEYTPQQLAGLSDEELILIFTEAKKPEGAHYRIASGDGRLSDERAGEVFRRFHTFAISPETSRGLVAYLRQLEPKSRGELDFGGLYSRRSK